MKKVIDTGKVPIKLWLDDIEDSALEQAKNLANLPFIFKHVAIMPDAHSGYGMPIGGVIATKDVIIPNAVGVDISCGMHVVKTDIKVDDLDKETIKKILGGNKEFQGGVRSNIPVGFSHHSKAEYDAWLPPFDKNDIDKSLPIVSQQYNKARYQLGTLGSGNHFVEFQKDFNGLVWFMIHSGSRNLGYTVANHYNDVAIKLNDKYFSQVPKNWQLAFLPLDSDEGANYLREMNYCVDFARQNRALMAYIIKQCIKEHLPNARFTWEYDIPHNYASLENHFGENVWVHRKGATRVRKDELGIIPGSQGTKSYIVKGLGNPESFMSCSHGAGRKMSRTKAKELLNLQDEIKKMDDQGIIHGIRQKSNLDEAAGAYKDIASVMTNQSDLVEVVEELTPIAVVKG